MTAKSKRLFKSHELFITAHQLWGPRLALYKNPFFVKVNHSWRWSELFELAKIIYEPKNYWGGENGSFKMTFGAVLRSWIRKGLVRKIARGEYTFSMSLGYVGNFGYHFLSKFPNRISNSGDFW